MRPALKTSADTPALPDDPPWLPTLAEEARLDRQHFDREHPEPDDD
jgi:hypothetical protein